jgi:hypothetical protein
MNDEIDQLEAELAALVPLPPSPELKQRLEIALTTELATRKRPGNRPRAKWIAAAAGGLIAASVAAGLLLFAPPRQQPPDASLPPLEMPIAAAFDDAAPTLWTYRRALARSPDEVETLLDDHAASWPPRGRAPVHLFIHADRELLFQGEL